LGGLKLPASGVPKYFAVNDVALHPWMWKKYECKRRSRHQMADARPILNSILTTHNMMGNVCAGGGYRNFICDIIIQWVTGNHNLTCFQSPQEIFKAA
jgi:hypothetical protein